MTQKEMIQFALTVSNGAMMGVIDKVADAATTFPTPHGGCHPLWVLGHLTMVEGFMPAVLFGEKNPLADWQTLFGEGTQPVADAAAYPPFEEIRAKYQEMRERNLKLLDSLTEEDLDRPTQAPPPGREKEFSTFGRSFLVLAMHQMMHRSHLTDALRAASLVAVPASV